MGSGLSAAAVALVVALVATPGVPAAGQPADAASGACAVRYQVNQWTGGFTADVAVTNLGIPVTSWTLTWTFGAGQQVTSYWNVRLTQTGQAVSAASEAYNGQLGTGATAGFGFQATYSGSNPEPGDFAFNGVPCSGGASASPSPTGGSPTPTPSSTATAADCAAGLVLCDGFEDQTGSTPAGRWTVDTPDCAGTGAAAVDSTVAHSGTRSVRIDGADGYCNHVFIADTADMTAAAPTWYVRVWVRHATALPAGHVTFLAMNDSAAGNTDLRFGGQNGALMWNRETDDATLPAQSPAGVAQSVPLPTDTWTCVEFAVDGGTGQIHTSVNGSEVPGLVEDGVPTADIDQQWLSNTSWRPQLTDLKLGWESYGGGGPDTLWFDDVALATSPIGCA